jgi:hypothetical protein
MRLLVLICGIVCYVVFLGAFLYAIGFVTNFAVPKGIDDGTAGDLATSLLVDVLLLGMFATRRSVRIQNPIKPSWMTRLDWQS